MNRSPKPLHELIEAARAEASPMSAQDVSELVRSAPAPGSSFFGGHAMTPILVAATTALAALAGTLVILQSPTPTPTPQPVQPELTAMAAVTLPFSTPFDTLTPPPVQACAARTSGASRSGLCTGDLSLEYLPTLAGLDIENAEQIDMCRNNNTMHITVVTNGVTRRAVVPIDDAHLPMMVTDAIGRGRCLERGDADVNRLIPVESGTGSQKVIMWFAPTQEFFQALPDSLGREMEGLMDVNVDVQVRDGQMRIRTQKKNADGTRIEEVQEMMAPDMPDMPDMEMINQKIRIVMDSTNVMLRELSKDMKMLHINIDSMVRDVKLCDTSMKTTRKQSVRIRTMVRSNRCQNIKAGIQELTRPSNGALSDATLYPNPATNGQTTLSFVLGEDRLVSVSVVDLSGATVADVVRSQRFASGMRDISIPVSGIAPGMYVVKVQTDKAEMLSKRIIVE
ncbi:hypothetical protein BH10BAC6_BH10BAC6_09430 [soil metagenome]